MKNDHILAAALRDRPLIVDWNTTHSLSGAIRVEILGPLPSDQLVALSRLFAAAPQLLEACRKAEEFVEGFEGDESQKPGSIACLLVSLRAAVSRAGGVR